MIKSFFKDKTKEEDVLNVPEHIAIIMDGNGRWAKKRNMPRNMGHKAGGENVKTITKACDKLGVKYLTLYAFSTENWKRPEEEVSGLMDLLVFFLKSELKELHENHVRIRTIGDISHLPKKTKQVLDDSIEVTKNNTGLNLVLALNYGSRNEITLAVKAIGSKLKDGSLDLDDINEDLIAEHLDTADMPDPDLMIRTSGELRLSNYMLWQLAYSEFYFTDVYWPDFGEEALMEAVKVYSNRQRRFGAV
ncbi:isoprenyl transferase [Acidaminobacter sp. JC074]|uniref:isoprenyl transferase n=1 Tax=Acidaminobacter sp. JC074 TaxID=2530199 RepID=UPI001F0FF8CF|nr:isoprenyl transferase [Acidaminobacter sp. JC074]MCH4888756.1 isoprenyl transferase [Acidaminobacter sp. JC074]